MTVVGGRLAGLHSSLLTCHVRNLLVAVVRRRAGTGLRGRGYGDWTQEPRGSNPSRGLWNGLGPIGAGSYRLLNLDGEMADQRRKNVNWIVALPNGDVPTWERVSIAVLMDIRDDLQRLCRIFECYNFQRMPRDLAIVRRNTTKRKRKPKGKV